MGIRKKIAELEAQLFQTRGAIAWVQSYSPYKTGYNLDPNGIVRLFLHEVMEQDMAKLRELQHLPLPSLPSQPSLWEEQGR